MTQNGPLVEECGKRQGQVAPCDLDVEKCELSKGAFFRPKNSRETGCSVTLERVITPVIHGIFRTEPVVCQAQCPGCYIFPLPLLVK